VGQIFFTVLAVVFVFQIIRNRGVKKLPWFFAGILFFPPAVVILQTPFVPFYRLMVYSLLMVAIIEKGNFFYELYKFPLRNALLFLLLLLLIVGVFDPRLSLFLKVYRPFYYYVENFFIIFLVYYYIRDYKDLQYLYDKIVFFLFLFALYGISNFLTQQSEYYNFIVKVYGGRNFAESNMANGVDRFRITSFSWHAIYYGFLINMVVLMQIFVLNALQVKSIKKWLYLIILFLLLINLLLVNSRTPLFSLLAGVCIFITLGVSKSQKLKITFLATIILIFAVNFIPSASRLFNESINTFSDKGSKLEGSTLEMREVQLAASFIEFSKSPIVGNGFGYIVENLGYSSESDERSSDSDFYGFESYIYELLIEQGTAGITGNFILFIIISFFLIKSSFSDYSIVSKLAVSSLAMFASFLLFIFGTGDLGAFTFFMAILGINIKSIRLYKERIQTAENILNIVLVSQKKVVNLIK
jgi:hypothetical protein